MKPTALFDRELLENPLAPEEAEELFSLEGSAVHLLLAAASFHREKHLGRRVSLCGIVNAKSGRCAEDCSFCAQASRFDTGAPVFPLLSAEALEKAAGAASANRVSCFSVVTSGKSIRDGAELRTLKNSLPRIKNAACASPCASLGILSYETLCELKAAGLERYHHNLETSRGFFPKICSTHDYDDDVRCVKDAGRAGLKVCSGGIFGLGESSADRVELAFTLKELDVHSIPINFLNPIPGTPLGDRPTLEPLEALKIVAVYRLVHPTKEILVAGGREATLRSLHPLLLSGGASGLLVGDYLTTKGRVPADDLRMIADLGLTPG